MTPAARCVAALGLAVRDLPVPLYRAGHAAALVPAAHGGGDLDLHGHPVPVLEVAAAADAGTVGWDLAAAAARLRTPGADAVAAAGDVDAAVVRALYRALARRFAPGAGPVRRLTGWEPALPGPWRHPADVAGSVACYLLGDVCGVPVVGAVARLDGDPRGYAALACDLGVPGAVAAALDGVRRALAVADLTRTDRNDHTDRADHADRGTRGDRGARGEDPTARGRAAPGAAGEVDLGGLRQDGADRAELGDLLRRHGLRPSARVLRAADDAALVQVRLDDGAPTPCRPGPPGRHADGDGQPGPWDEPDVPALRLTAPTQLSLAFAGSRVAAGRTYHEHSKVRAAFGTLPRVDIRDMGRPTRLLIGRAYRDFRHARLRYRLRPDPDLPVRGLRETILRRRSWTPMTGGSIDRAALAGVLHLTYGVTGAGATGDDVTLPLRATPAAGGLYAVDLFLLVERVEGVAPGLYYFHPAAGELQLVRSDVRLADLAGATGYGARVTQAAAVVVYVAALRRTQWKYWERGYRMALLDCGHLAQSVVLTANAAGLAAHPMVAFVDDDLNRLVGVDGVDDAALYLTLLGPAGTPARKENP
ncbi:hypothetical protein GCM10010124_28030 [Pilimelia terevasa]|uniref:Nitroreductase domain-containing protein n=1 Tax=Pilimelia terevasa TaxID=53372 RepID=A0A8J3BTL3_9ACTN|nr:SagB/ThcOx family dehydrogenase [Pilimelia terevasa]GGK33891.1 hypothetical protein GCM10010124_28030 [Pilimelia terevasa]